MAIDYSAVKIDNIKRYGTDIGRIGPMLLANRYGERTHFIFELLQNAEDALKRREEWKGPRSVNFTLSMNVLRVSHYGEPFEESDVRGICGIGESTKSEGLTSIGTFGIGFKSVYAFTDFPEVHSGRESFAVDSFVWPRAIESVNGDNDETTFVFPFRKDDEGAFEEIAKRLKGLGARTLLFLREVEEISWSIEDGQSGLYLRSEPEEVDANCRKVILIGQEEGCEDTEETWLIFSKEVFNDEETSAGFVEIAFKEEGAEEKPTIVHVPESKLVVYFPTIVSTNLGFLVQGPYRTTPSRDNVPGDDDWNQCLVKETGSLLVEALCSLRDQGMLDVNLLRCLPLDRDKFSEDCMFKPLFDMVCDALVTKSLLPCSDGGHTSAENAKLARTKDIQELFDTDQLTSLYNHDGKLHWLTEGVTLNTTPELRQYLIRELSIAEVTPEMAISKMRKAFLDIQTDEWIVKLYEFLNGQTGLKHRFIQLPLIRLENNSHVVVKLNGQIQAFLPSEFDTGFPTVKRSICQTEEVSQFLKTLGLTEPDPVDDVIRNILPRYSEDELEDDLTRYGNDINMILTAFETDSIVQRTKLLEALHETYFVMAKKGGDDSGWRESPDRVYLASDRIKNLFCGVADVMIVDDNYECLRGESVRKLLEACGASRGLKRVSVQNKLSYQELVEIRRNAGLERATWGNPPNDFSLMGLEELFSLIPELDIEGRREKANLLWEALDQLVTRRGSGTFKIEYTWGFGQMSRTEQLDADFVKELNTVAWIPDVEGELQRPEFILFESLGWKPNPILLSNIRFKAPVIETLAREAGFEPGMLDLLKKLGVTSVDELRTRLALDGDSESPVLPEPDEESEMSAPIPPDLTGTGVSGLGNTGGNKMGRGMGTGGNDRVKGQGGNSGGGGNKRTPGSKGGRPFISYVGVHPNKGEIDPDGLDHHKRMELEKKAIEFILSEEPSLKCMPPNNHGFDLFEPGLDGQHARRIEVKAMTGPFAGRPVGLSRRQFDCAREHGETYWLYVVENVKDEDNSRVIRIQDPAGKAQTFTFDSGWLGVAKVTPWI